MNFLKRASDADKKDPLIRYKDYFVKDDNLIYLDGNSLGKLPLKTVERLEELVKEQWGRRLIRSWNENWMELSERIAGKIAPLVGAGKDEIFVSDSTSVNLYKLAFAALNENKNKNNIISDELNFPTDLYVIQGLINHQFKDHALRLMKSTDGISVEKAQLERLIDHKTALVTLSYVVYKSAFMYDMEWVNTTAHEHGSFVCWDLSHAAGAVKVELNKTNTDMAIGCTYKYLNGGPGAPAFLYVRKDLQQKLMNPINSWFGHEKPFDFNPDFQAATSIQKFAAGTPNILSLAAIEPGLDIMLEAGITSIRQKSIDQTNFLVELIKTALLPMGFSIASPPNHINRGSHISVQHPDAYRINRAMIEPLGENKIMIPDFRPPNNIRLGITPLYTSFQDIHEAVMRIKEIVVSKEYKRFSNQKLTVT